MFSGRAWLAVWHTELSSFVMIKICTFVSIFKLLLSLTLWTFTESTSWYFNLANWLRKKQTLVILMDKIPSARAEVMFSLTETQIREEGPWVATMVDLFLSKPKKWKDHRLESRETKNWCHQTLKWWHNCLFEEWLHETRALRHNAVIIGCADNQV